MKHTPKRNKDGLFKTHCLNCGATLYNATNAEPHPNCDQCPGHDDIARRDQAAADRTIGKHPSLGAPFSPDAFRAETYANDIYARINEVSPKPQFDYEHLKSPDYRKNLKLKPHEISRCILCGRPCVGPKYLVWEHLGGGTVVTRAEGERLNAAGEGGSDLGGQPIGPDCLKKHPELKPYVNEE